MKDVIKKLLNEALFHKNSKEQVALIEEFVKFICQELGIKQTPVHLKFTRDGLKTTAVYTNKKVYVYAKDRAVVDIMRSIAHEYTHMQQDVSGNLDHQTAEKNTEAGSVIENEANYKAGELLRKFGEKHPEIYL